MGTGDSLIDVVLKLQDSAGFSGDLFTGINEGGIGPVLFRRAGDKVHAHLGTADHERIAHVVTGVAHIDKLNAFQITEVFLDGQEVGQDLGGMELIGEAIPDRNAGILREIFHDILTETAVFNAVIHAAQNTGGIGNTFLFTDLASGGIQISAVHSQIIGGNLKRATGTGAGLFKDQGNVFPGTAGMRNACFLFGLKVSSKIQERRDLIGSKIKKLQEAITFERIHKYHLR